MSDEENYYLLLKSDKNASVETLRNNYKALVRQCHPDKCSVRSESVNFLKIQKAWTTLKDPIERKRYDSILFNQIQVFFFYITYRKQINF